MSSIFSWALNIFIADIINVLYSKIDCVSLQICRENTIWDTTFSSEIRRM